MKVLNENELKEIVGGFNKGKCFVAVSGGALSFGAKGSRLGWQGALAGGLIGGGIGAYRFCR